VAVHSRLFGTESHKTSLDRFCSAVWRGLSNQRSAGVGCGDNRGEGRWGLVAERGMGSRGVEVLPPFGDGASGVAEAKEQALVQKLVAHSAVEGFDVAVLHRLSRRDVVPLDAMILRPGEDRVRGELGNDHAGLATLGDQVRQFASDTAAGERSVRDRGLKPIRPYVSRSDWPSLYDIRA
jgi:hypothetical protein